METSVYHYYHLVCILVLSCCQSCTFFNLKFTQINFFLTHISTTTVNGVLEGHVGITLYLQFSFINAHLFGTLYLYFSNTYYKMQWDFFLQKDKRNDKALKNEKQ